MNADIFSKIRPVIRVIKNGRYLAMTDRMVGIRMAVIAGTEVEAKERLAALLKAYL